MAGGDSETRQVAPWVPFLIEHMDANRALIVDVSYEAICDICPIYTSTYGYLIEHDLRYKQSSLKLPFTARFARCCPALPRIFLWICLRGLFRSPQMAGCPTERSPIYFKTNLDVAIK